MKAFICRVWGHKPISGPLQRSPYTVYTHWREVTCSRCGELLRTEREYIDARPEWAKAGEKPPEERP